MGDRLTFALRGHEVHTLDAEDGSSSRSAGSAASQYESGNSVMGSFQAQSLGAPFNYTYDQDRADARSRLEQRLSRTGGEVGNRDDSNFDASSGASSRGRAGLAAPTFTQGGRRGSFAGESYSTSQTRRATMGNMRGVPAGGSFFDSVRAGLDRLPFPPAVLAAVGALLVIALLVLILGRGCSACSRDGGSAVDATVVPSSSQTAADSGDSEAKGVISVSGVEGAESASGSSAVSSANATPRGGKLAGSTETVDANGIVHGTTPSGIKYTVLGRGERGNSFSSDRVTLVAGGDQIGTDEALAFADSWAGTVGDGQYDFTPFYKEISGFINRFDLKYVNQETPMVGNDEWSYTGYPSFNTPDAAVDALYQTGFNAVNFCSNHVLDYGEYGAERSLQVFSHYPSMLVMGSYASDEDRNTVHMIERNGMTFAFLGYTYGDNYLGTFQNFPNQHILCGFDNAAMEADIRRAQQVADVVIVSMHWGDEYVNWPNGDQQAYATWLADLDVDLVLGTHSHAVQAVTMVTGTSGNTIPVVYGLGDLVSTYSLVDTVLAGLFTCDFTRTYVDLTPAQQVLYQAYKQGIGPADSSTFEGASYRVDVGNLKWYATVEWADGAGQDYVRFLASMDEAETNANALIKDIPANTQYEYMRNKLVSVGMQIPIVM